MHTAVVIPDIARVHLRKRRPMPDASGSLAGPFPLPEETCPTGQLPLQNHVLVVVVVAFAFTGGIGRFDQALAGVVAVGNQCLLGTPGVFQGVGRMKTLILDGDDVPAVIAQQQRTPGAVVEALDPVRRVALHRQPIAVGIADRRQSSCTKVVKTALFRRPVRGSVLPARPPDKSPPATGCCESPGARYSAAERSCDGFRGRSR